MMNPQRIFLLYLLSSILILAVAADFVSAMVHLGKRMMTLREYFRFLLKTKVKRYYNKHDLSVFFGLFLNAISQVFKK